MDHTGAEAGTVVLLDQGSGSSRKTTSTTALRFIGRLQPMKWPPFHRPQAANEMRALVDVVFCILDHTGAEAGAVPAGPGKWKLAKKHLSS